MEAGIISRYSWLEYTVYETIRLASCSRTSWPEFLIGELRLSGCREVLCTGDVLNYFSWYTWSSL